MKNDKIVPPGNAAVKLFSTFLLLVGLFLSGVANAQMSWAPVGPYAFGNVVVGAQSDATFTLTNNSGAPTTSLAIAVTPVSEFSIQSNTCPAALANAASCTVVIRFNPTAVASVTGFATATATGIVGASLSLTGTGVASGGAAIAVSPTSLAFGTVGVTKTLDKQLTVTAGASDVSSVTFTAPAGYSVQANTCNTTIPATKSCTVTIRFGPTVATSYVGSLKVVAGTTTLYVDLTGTGSSSTPGGGSLAASVTSLDFGAVRTNTTRSLQFTLTASTANVKVSAIEVPSGFAASHTCDPVVLSGKSCNVTVSFSPDSGGAYNGTLVLESDAAASPLLISLSGTAGSVQSADVPPLLGLDLSSHDFGSLVAGETKSFVFVLTNLGGQTLNNALAVSGAGFSVSSGSCYAAGNVSIAPGASCELSARFVPSAAGTYSGKMTFSGTGSGNAIINLSGRATGAATGGLVNPTLSALVSSVDFGTVPVSSQLAKPVGLLASTSGVTLTNLSLPEGYSATHDCGSTLASLGYCTVNVVFSPSAQRAFTGYLVLTTSSGYASFIPLAGQGGTINSLAAQSSGTSAARTVTAYYRFTEQYQGRAGNLYVAVSHNGELYFLSGSTVTKHQEGVEPTPYVVGPYQSTDITIFNAEDLRQFSGASVYLGYGNNLAEVLDNQQYSLVYTLH